MVDFQSRGTRRDDPAEADGSGTDADDGSDETDPGALGVALVTVGSERSVDDDTGGEAVVAAIGDVGDVVTREVIDDRYDGVQTTVGTVAKRGDVDVVVTVGGTGPEPDDVTVDAVAPLLDKHLPGVGELIRRHCADERGTAAVRTRATGGTLDGVPVFCLPGDPDLARIAAVEVVVPEAGALADLAALPDEEEE